MPRYGINGSLAAVLVLVVGGCAPASAPPATSSPPGSLAESANPVGSAAATPPAVPPAFPLPAGTVALPIGVDEPEVVGRWSVPVDGAAAYDFYLAALPERGFVVSDVFPGGGGAAIIFRDADGVSWQLTIEGPAPTIVELHPDPG